MKPVNRRLGSPKYVPPANVGETTLIALVDNLRFVPDGQQVRFGFGGGTSPSMQLWYAGDADLARRVCVAIVGTRKVSAEGAARARRLARELVEAGVVVVSGLADGVDTCAHSSAIEAGGRTIAVIGTPLDKAFPRANAQLQEAIARDHLLLSQFAPGSPVAKWNFPARNRLMATISDATVIVEASDTSGTLHQAAECVRLTRPLFIAKSVIDNPKLSWPEKFLRGPTVHSLTATEDILKVIPDAASRDPDRSVRSPAGRAKQRGVGRI
jgi:DNA processing protein